MTKNSTFIRGNKAGCPYCQSPKYDKAGQDNSGLQRYKCLNCLRRCTVNTNPQPKPPKHLEIVECLYCGCETTNPKFCSSSCAAKYNNVTVPKRSKQQIFCKHCSAPITGYRKICDKCYINPRIDWSQRTIGDIQKTAKYQVSAALRILARQEFAKSDRPACVKTAAMTSMSRSAIFKASTCFRPIPPFSSLAASTTSSASAQTAIGSSIMACCTMKIFRRSNNQ